MMRVLRIVAMVFAALLFGVCSANAQSLRLFNDYGERVYLWQWLPSAWDNPPLFLQRNGDGYIDLSRPGQYYFTVMDSQDRERKIGWLDLHPVYQIDPNAGISVRELFFTEARTGTVLVWNRRRRRWETRVINEEVRVPSGMAQMHVYSGGKLYYLDDFISRFSR